MNNIEQLLEKYLKNLKVEQDNRAYNASVYSLMVGGKRLRPNFVFEIAKMIDKMDENLERIAVAIEMLHTYSLIHDDLPCMDDDDMRRGKPSCHVQYDYGTAVLAGDALQSMAFETLAMSKDAKMLPIINQLAYCSGINGMIYGQTLDVGEIKDIGSYIKMVEHKTAKLFVASIVAPAMYLEFNERNIALLQKYATNFGVLFQIADDIDDKDGYASSHIEEVKLLGEECYNYAMKCIKALEMNTKYFEDLLDKIYDKIKTK